MSVVCHEIKICPLSVSQLSLLHGFLSNFGLLIALTTPRIFYLQYLFIYLFFETKRHFPIFTIFFRFHNVGPSENKNFKKLLLPQIAFHSFSISSDFFSQFLTKVLF